MSAYEYMGAPPGRWWPAVSVLVRPSIWLPRPDVVVHGDPAASMLAAAERVRQWREGDAFTGPAKVPEVINRECEPAEAPGTLAKLYASAVARGWTAWVTHGRGWGVRAYGKPGRRLVDSYALRLSMVCTDGREVRAYGLWADGDADSAGALFLPQGVRVHMNITRLAEVINSVELRQSDV